MFESKNVISVAGDLYAKNPAALKRLLRRLTASGYEIQDNRLDGYSIRKGEVDAETMEKNGWSLWHAKLPDIRRGKCNSCGSLIKVYAIHYHDHRCEVCGEPTYLDLVKGSTIRFNFVAEESGFVTPELNMEVYSWDYQNGDLYLLPNPLDSGGLFTLKGKQASDYLQKMSNYWQWAELDGVTLIKVKNPLPWKRDPANIEPVDHWGSVINHKVVKIWDGVEYGEYDRDFPLPEMINIFEAWHWAPLPVSDRLYSRILSSAHQGDDMGWHHQNGSPWFTAKHWEEMGKFVRHFTLLDADAYDEASKRFRSDGPGGITDIARFCSAKSVLRNEPNIGNLLEAMGNHLDGRPLSDKEQTEAVRALDTDEGMEFALSLFRLK